MRLVCSVLLALLFLLIGFNSVAAPSPSEEMMAQVEPEEIVLEEPEEVIQEEPTIGVEEIKALIKFYKPKMSEDTVSNYAKWIVREATNYDFDPVLITAMIYQESSFNANNISSAGAVGLMQMLPSTSRKIFGVEGAEKKLLDPEFNISQGLKYLDYLRTYYKGDERMAVLAYNQGMGNISRGTYNTRYLSRVGRHEENMRNWLANYLAEREEK